MKNRIIAVIAASLLVMSAAASAQPARNVSGRRHQNLAAAQRLCRQAYQRIIDAQNANEWDLNGHAQRAKELLDQVNSELKMAAETANVHRHRR